jgi:hypothetical protein
MFPNVALLGVVAAIDPGGIGAVAFFLSRRDPRRLLLAYLVGGMGVSLIAGVVALFVLKDVGAGSSSSVPPGIEIAVGALALAGVVGSGLSARIGTRLKSRRAARQTSGDGDRSGTGEAAGGETHARSGGVPGIEKLPPRLRGALENESPWVAWIAGVAYGMPGAYYLAAIAIVLKSGSAPPAQVAAVRVFNVLLLSAAIVPLVAYARAPEATQTEVEGLQKWVGAHQRLVVACVAGVIGAYLVVIGITKL